MCDNHLDPVVETRRKARKAHVCDECGLQIPVGAFYRAYPVDAHSPKP